MKDLEERRSSSAVTRTFSGKKISLVMRSDRQWAAGLLLCALGFVVCTLLTVTPLIRIPDDVIRLDIAAGSLLAGISNWMPVRIGTLAQTAYGEFFCALFLASLCYALAALSLQRRSASTSARLLRVYIGLGALLAGAIYIVTPAMLSHDVIVYASYGRVLSAYQANPYFTPIAAFPADPFTPLNYWSQTVSAYGPVWTLICGVFGWLLSPEPAIYVIAFRILGLALHLLNIYLVGRILLTMERTPREVTLGMLLYAWNPLVLLESSLGAHNDVLMVTFVLLGALLAVRAERGGYFLRARGYLPPLIALTLSVLVKFTALPILAVYFLWLACKALASGEKPTWRNWRSALPALIWCALTAIGISLALYGPFWFGYSLGDILASFRSPPSAIGAQNSFMRSVIEWLAAHPTQRTNELLTLLTRRVFWDDLNYLVIAGCLVGGAIRLWLKPVARTFLLVALAIWSIILFTTPWFYSWYITWIIGLVALCLPMRGTRVQAALLAFVLTFSFSALITYLFNGGLLDSTYYLVSLFTMIPPVCAFLLTLVIWQPGKYQRSGDTA